MKEKCLSLLEKRGVTMDDLIELVNFLQRDYIAEIDE